ncbi:hypothetical protein KDA11_04920 [Candidatus Saccharibacteria bacterium]|nr:hypothetical protein [Candidatus Saccharibacteria bacterium]
MLVKPSAVVKVPITTVSRAGLIPAKTAGTYKYEGYFTTPQGPEICGPECTPETGYGFYFVNETNSDCTLRMYNLATKSNGTCQSAGSDFYDVQTIPATGNFYWAGESLQQAFSVPFVGASVGIVDKEGNELTLLQQGVTDVRKEKRASWLKRITLENLPGAGGFIFGKIKEIPIPGVSAATTVVQLATNAVFDSIGDGDL